MRAKKINVTDNAADWMDIDALTPWAENPRENKKAIGKVAESIARFGFASPIIARKENLEIIAGHTRWAAARKLGLDRVPVRVLDLSESEARLLALADNKLGEIADWNDDLLQKILSEYEESDRLVAGWEEDAKVDEDDPDRIEDNRQFALMLNFDNEEDLQRAFDLCSEKGWPCKIIE